MNQGATGGREGDSAGRAKNRVAVTTFTLGPFETNCYVVQPGGGEPGGRVAEGERAPCWIIDASFGPRDLIEHVRSHNLEPEALVLTHAHADHIAGVAEVRKAWPRLPVFIHWEETEWLNDPVLNLSMMSGMPVTAPGPDRELSEGDALALGDTTWKVLHTPGHSPGGVTLYCEDAKVAFVGDALFAGSVGRTDFPGSDPDQLVASIKAKLYTLPDDVKLYPGHGPTTTIGREKRSNPYVRG